MNVLLEVDKSTSNNLSLPWDKLLPCFFSDLIFYKCLTQIYMNYRSAKQKAICESINHIFCSQSVQGQYMSCPEWNREEIVCFVLPIDIAFADTYAVLLCNIFLGPKKNLLFLYLWFLVSSTPYVRFWCSSLLVCVSNLRLHLWLCMLIFFFFLFFFRRESLGSE